VIASLPALARYLRREQPAVLLSAMSHANIVALWARRLSGASTRVVVSERVTLSVVAAQTSRRRGRLRPHLIRWFYPWADGIVAVSRGVADDLARTAGLDRERIDVIYNPIGTPELRELAQAPVDHPWLSSDGPPVVLAAGRLLPQKDFPTLIRAFARVRRLRTARLLVLGEGEQRSLLRDLARTLGIEAEVDLPGFVPNPYAYMARASLFVLSSRFEGLPGVLIEALCCGVPVVATDCPSGPREILEEGRYGRLVPVGDEAALGEAIGDALAGGVARPPPESWARFGLETVVDQYLALFRSSVA
jgi:glycosyltransferase involved in cell wall biosynthesis